MDKNTLLHRAVGAFDPFDFVDGQDNGCLGIARMFGVEQAKLYGVVLEQSNLIAMNRARICTRVDFGIDIIEIQLGQMNIFTLPYDELFDGGTFGLGWCLFYTKTKTLRLQRKEEGLGMLLQG